MQYKDVVKAMFAKHKGKMPAKDIMKLAAAEYRKMRGSAKPRGRGVSGGDMSDPAAFREAMNLADELNKIDGYGSGLRRGRGRKARGGDMTDQLNGLLRIANAGSGLSRGRKMKGAGGIADVAQPFVDVADSIGSLFGLGLDKQKKPRAGRKMKGAGGIADVAQPFVNLADSIGSIFGLGLDEKKKGKKKSARGGYMSAGAMSAGDFPIAMVPPAGGSAIVPIQNPPAGGNLLTTASHLLPFLALV